MVRYSIEKRSRNRCGHGRAIASVLSYNVTDVFVTLSAPLPELLYRRYSFPWSEAYTLYTSLYHISFRIYTSMLRYGVDGLLKSFRFGTEMLRIRKLDTIQLECINFSKNVILIIFFQYLCLLPEGSWKLN